MTVSQPILLHEGSVKGAPSLELHFNSDDTNEVLIVGNGGTPTPTGVSLDKTTNGYRIHCIKRNAWFKFKPEEPIRQFALKKILDELDYPIKDVAVEYGIQMGSKVHDKPADIVVFQHGDPFIVVEVKKPGRKDGIEQLKSYMNASGAPFGWWTNGADEQFLLRTGANNFSQLIWRLPKNGESLEMLKSPITRDKLEPVKDLYAIFKDMEQEILSHQTVDTFNEIFKIVFAKLYDERVNLPRNNSEAKFQIQIGENKSLASKRIKALFAKATNKWRDVYDSKDKIELNDENISYCVSMLQKYHLMKSGDILGVAFELLVNQEMKGEMGQFFTPRQVVDMMTKMVNPKLDERVCDPSCGSGGFLIYPMRHVFSYINETWDDPDDRAEQRKDYAQQCLMGMDNDYRLVRVAKAYMIMENDGRGGISTVDSLDYSSWNHQLKERITGRELEKTETDGAWLVKQEDRLDTDGVDIVLANPPFAGAIKSNNTLKQYNIAHDSKGKQSAQVVRANLFLERCLDILKPGGRMGIVLPQGIFNNITENSLRKYIDDKARILAVIGLHPYTFKPFTLAKTSILFVQKKRSDEVLPDNYPIFTAVSMKSGKNKLGRPEYQSDGITLDTDMDEIAVEFRKFVEAEGLGF